ncbi:hypothetical protein RR46_13841 [Papilio xuthus]|uniref:Uncharacterized protein n=1 Tax=Papilio xuthus TaxID=66420 RepID=A0A194PNC6_PAPXU|nr:hypothetical protein RR46_13841 [Papilio xuthus]
MFRGPIALHTQRNTETHQVTVTKRRSDVAIPAWTRVRCTFYFILRRFNPLMLTFISHYSDAHVMFNFILVCAVLTRVTSEPDPKKYKPEDADKDKKSSATLTNDEKKFLREVEEKFGIKPQVPVEISNTTDDKSTSANITEKTPLPAVIAIEIVNDTNSSSKGKRTIDANLGYGYRTNEGYTYTYFGKPKQEEGKFMIYPYSQQDSSEEYNGHSAEYSQQSSGQQSHATSVEIQPSRAFELVSVKDEHYNNDNSKSVESSPVYHEKETTTFPSTLYTTYNGEGLSGLSGHFPRLMSNYFVNPKQLLNNPHYQSIGLNQDHLSTNGLDQNKPVVPVLVLRIPSSYIKNPTAELYANLPSNYPLSHYLNNVNLQDLVNQYFKKNGYDSAPQVMAYQNPQLSTSITPTVSSTYSAEPQQYSNPHVQPSYTQSDYSGVQYSGVKPVMAKYPSTFGRPKYYSSRIQSQYRRPAQQPKYEYRYQYVPQTPGHTQAYYGQSLQKDPQVSTVATYEQQSDLAALATPSADTISNTDHGSSQYSSNYDGKVISVQFDSNTPSHSSQHADSSNIETPQYDYSKESQEAYSPQQSLTHDYSGQSIPDYTSSQLGGYYAQKQIESTETVNAYPSHTQNTEQEQQTYSEVSATQGYDYPKPREESVGNSYVVPETYSNKDHTIATVLPFTYKQPKRPNTATVQTVSYVTPEPSSKYQSRYRIMVPQTILKSQDEKVTYVNSMPMHYTKVGYYNQDYNSEENTKYSVGNYYSAPTNKHKTGSYTRNYQNYLKRMARPDSKAEGSSNSSRSKKSNDKKKSS